MRKRQGTQTSCHGDLADLESFQSSREEIRAFMSQVNPSLYEVLGEIASSMQPIREGDILQASQRNLSKGHRALRALQAKIKHASFTEDEAHQSVDEYTPTEADKLRTRQAERQLGCLLVMKTKGETQLHVCRWLTASNSWEAWRQLNLHCIRKRSLHFELLANIISALILYQLLACNNLKHGRSMW